MVVEWFETWTCQTLRSRNIIFRSTLIRSDLPPVCRCNLQRWFPYFVKFDQTKLTSLVPFDRLIECPSILTPDETQAVIRYHLCLYRRCKRNHLLCSSSCPFEASSIGSLAFSSTRSHLSRYALPLLSLSLTTMNFRTSQHKAVWKLPRKGVLGRPSEI